MRVYLLIITLYFSLIPLKIFSQKFKAINNDVNSVLIRGGEYHDLLKLSLFTGFRTGSSIGLSFGMWKEGRPFQIGLNTGFMWRFGKYILGNYRNGFEPKDNRTRSQFVFMYTPLLTTRLSSEDHVYQEVEPFYMGTPSAVFCKFKHSLTIGSTFTVSPRSYKHVTTVRNRSQQVFVVSLNIKNVNVTIYDDFFPFATGKLQLGDNWDRFFSGGGFLRYRANGELTFRLYSEVYTGINRVNNFLFPDIISYKKKGNKWNLKNFANQDPGQEFFNSASSRLRISYSKKFEPSGKQFYQPDFDFYVGTSAAWGMMVQNFIHTWFKTDKKNDLKLHYFLPRTNVPGNLEFGGDNLLTYTLNGIGFGVGSSYNILKFLIMKLIKVLALLFNIFYSFCCAAQTDSVSQKLNRIELIKKSLEEEIFVRRFESIETPCVYIDVNNNNIALEHRDITNSDYRIQLFANDNFVESGVQCLSKFCSQYLKFIPTYSDAEKLTISGDFKLSYGYPASSIIQFLGFSHQSADPQEAFLSTLLTAEGKFQMFPENDKYRILIFFNPNGPHDPKDSFHAYLEIVKNAFRDDELSYHIYFDGISMSKGDKKSPIFLRYVSTSFSKEAIYYTNLVYNTIRFENDRTNSKARAEALWLINFLTNPQCPQCDYVYRQARSITPVLNLPNTEPIPAH